MGLLGVAVPVAVVAAVVAAAVAVAALEEWVRSAALTARREGLGEDDARTRSAGGMITPPTPLSLPPAPRAARGEGFTERLVSPKVFVVGCAGGACELPIRKYRLYNEWRGAPLLAPRAGARALLARGACVRWLESRNAARAPLPAPTVAAGTV